MNKPMVSERFDIDDIRKIRDINALRHADMTPAEIVSDTRNAAAALIRTIQNRSSGKQVRLITSKHNSALDAPAS